MTMLKKKRLEKWEFGDIGIPKNHDEGSRASIELDNVPINVEKERCVLEVDNIWVESFDGSLIRCIFQTPVMITSDENFIEMWQDSHPVQSSIHPVLETWIVRGHLHE